MKKLWEIIKSITIIKLLITKLTIEPFIAIRNSYFKCLKGEEKLWKVILFWEVLTYCVVLIFFPLLLFPLLHYNNPDNLIILLLLEIFLILIIIKFLIKPFIITIRKSYFKCLKGEEKIWRVILLWGVLPYFIVLIFFPYSEDWYSGKWHYLIFLNLPFINLHHLFFMNILFKYDAKGYFNEIKAEQIFCNIISIVLILPLVLSFVPRYNHHIELSLMICSFLLWPLAIIYFACYLVLSIARENKKRLLMSIIAIIFIVILDLFFFLLLFINYVGATD